MTEDKILTLSEFLSNTPPQTLVRVDDLGRQVAYEGFKLNTPPISIHCDTDHCRDKGLLVFRCTDKEKWEPESGNYLATYRYICSNCRSKEKVYSVIYAHGDTGIGGSMTTPCIKVGEFPNFGPPTPARLITAIGPGRNLFLKGRRCENQGLGVGAFSYYRRVIEDQKDRLFDQIIKITEIVEPGSPLLAELVAAKGETQFTKSVDAIKTALPQTLLINGSNPLTLLHSALSEGLHAKTDEECLEIASMIRTVLTEFSKKVAAAISENKELVEAVTKLNQMQSQKTKSPG